MPRNALMASRHPCYNGAGDYLCGCGEVSLSLKLHRYHLYLSESCRAKNATNGDLKWVAEHEDNRRKARRVKVSFLDCKQSALRKDYLYTVAQQLRSELQRIAAQDANALAPGWKHWRAIAKEALHDS